MTDFGLDWYPLRDAAGVLTMRLYNRAINIRWGTYCGPACFVGPPAAVKPFWGEPVKEGKRKYFRELPPRRVKSYNARGDVAAGDYVEPSPAMLERQGWGPEPDAWQPLPADQWPLPLPETLPRVAAGLMTRIDHIRFDAAAAAAEMEEDRRVAENRKEEKEPVRVPFWRDASVITYSERGAVTPRECEGRVLRALYWLGAGALALPVTHGTAIGRMTATSPEEETEDAATLPPLVRGPGETDDRLLEAMDWIAELYFAFPNSGAYWAEIMFVQATDRPLTYSRIASFFGASASSVRESEKRALRHLTKIANTGTPYLDASRAATVERNRAYARSTYS